MTYIAASGKGRFNDTMSVLINLNLKTEPSAFPPDLPVCSAIQKQTGSSCLHVGQSKAQATDL
ncbi:hypothetical protein JK222_14910 [Gluconobacter cerinus]|uniref:hypothetical protein n=1 Tax=Gluconobacter cerinus TaxID=38307 RepID=UPI001B8C5241|nr:hypothetical protein [Gluconobacter cerinus]MBS1072970.1 hypothetical protein [Gluconobacter cerinus]